MFWSGLFKRVVYFTIFSKGDSFKRVIYSRGYSYRARTIILLSHCSSISGRFMIKSILMKSMKITKHFFISISDLIIKVWRDTQNSISMTEALSYLRSEATLVYFWDMLSYLWSISSKISGTVYVNHKNPYSQKMTYVLILGP